MMKHRMAPPSLPLIGREKGTSETVTANGAPCRAFLLGQSTEDLCGMYDELARTYERAITFTERDLGMSIAEYTLEQMHRGNGAALFGMPVGDGGKLVRDFLPAGYGGVERAERGETLPELELNKIPPNIPLSRKVEIALAQFEAARKAASAGTLAGSVRLLIATAQCNLLTSTFAGTLLAVPPRPKTRAALVDAVFKFLQFAHKAISRKP